MPLVPEEISAWKIKNKTKTLSFRQSSHPSLPVSALLFGLIQWSMGLHAIISTALWGGLPMVVMIRTGSVVRP
jgi:hypothetical protein